MMFPEVNMWHEAGGKNISQADKKLVDLMIFALEHGVATVQIKGKGPLVPFVVTEIKGEREKHRFFTHHIEDGLSEAVRFLKDDEKSDFAALVYDAFLPIEDKNINAVVVRGYDRKDTVGYALGQRYLPSKFFSFFKLSGGKVSLGNADQLLRKL